MVGKVKPDLVESNSSFGTYLSEQTFVVLVEARNLINALQ